MLSAYWTLPPNRIPDYSPISSTTNTTTTTTTIVFVNEGISGLQWDFITKMEGPASA